MAEYWRVLGQEWCQRREGVKYSEGALIIKVRQGAINADLLLCEVRENLTTGEVQRMPIPVTELNYADK